MFRWSVNLDFISIVFGVVYVGDRPKGIRFLLFYKLNSDHIDIINDLKTFFFYIYILETGIFLQQFVRNPVIDINRTLLTTFIAIASPVLSMLIIIPVSMATGTGQRDNNQILFLFLNFDLYDPFILVTFLVDPFFEVADPAVGCRLILRAESDFGLRSIFEFETPRE